MSIKLLDLKSTIEFVPVGLKNAESDNPLVFHLKALDWFESFEVGTLLEIGTNEDGGRAYNINTKDRDKWYDFVVSKIDHIDNGGEELPVTVETIKALPKIIGVELVHKLVQLSQGVDEDTEKK